MLALQGQTYIPPTPGPVAKMVVFLHGYGASGDNLLGISHYWQDILPATVFAAPNGPEPCDVNPLGYQWFGLPDFSPFNIRQGLDRCAPVVASYLQTLMTTYQLAPQDVALVGFSQGTIVALEMLFLIPNLAGIIGYSGAFFPPTKCLVSPVTKVFLVHGTLDTVVPYTALMQAEKSLSALGINVKTHTCYNLDHSISEEGLQQGGEFLAHVLTPTDSLFKKGAVRSAL